MQKVLILGSAGMLGSALVKEFKSDYEVIGWDRADIDVTNEHEVKEKIEALKPAVIINATGHNGVDATETDSEVYELAKKINTTAVGTLARVARGLNAPLIHYSTDYVFDGSVADGYTEDATPRPISKYGETKFLGEELLRKNTDHFYLIRLSRLFGKPGPSETSKKSFVDIMLDEAGRQGGKKIPLVDEEVSCPTYSSDLARFTKILTRGSFPFGIYHGANSGACTWYEFGKKIFEIKNFPARVIPITSAEHPRAAKRPARSELLNTKLPPQRLWVEALTEYLSSN